MMLFFVVVIVYTSFLLLYRPLPNSLKGKPLTFIENFKCIKASLMIGVMLLVVFFLTSHFGFSEVDKKLYTVLGLSNIEYSEKLWPLQAFTHLFIHVNVIHTLTNVMGIGIASAYERRVGSKRFIAVLMIGALSSVPSILCYSEPMIICGISGGVFGLAAAYFTDHRDLTPKEWIGSILLFALLAMIVWLGDEASIASKEVIKPQVDHIGHVLGALGAICYCRLIPPKIKAKKKS